MLYFHSGVGSLVNRNTSLRFFARPNSHVQIKGGVNLILAVPDAYLFSGRLCTVIIRIDAVKMTAAEEELGQGCLHECFAFVLWVLDP